MPAPMIGPPFLPGADRMRPLPETWPGVTTPWQPWSPWATAARPLFRSDRLCLGADCWAISRLTLADADQMVKTLQRKSFPLAQAGLAAAALYEAGFRQHARGVLRIYGGIYGMEKVEEQIRRVYDYRKPQPGEGEGS